MLTLNVTVEIPAASTVCQCSTSILKLIIRRTSSCLLNQLKFYDFKFKQYFIHKYVNGIGQQALLMLALSLNSMMNVRWSDQVG